MEEEKEVQPKAEHDQAAGKAPPAAWRSGQCKFPVCAERAEQAWQAHEEKVAKRDQVKKDAAAPAAAAKEPAAAPAGPPTTRVRQNMWNKAAVPPNLRAAMDNLETTTPQQKPLRRSNRHHRLRAEDDLGKVHNIPPRLAQHLKPHVKDDTRFPGMEMET